jgi:hypothetical protein
MPVLPILEGIAGIAGVANAFGQQNQQNAAQQQQLALTKQQVELEAQKFGWTKEQTEAELKRRLESANRYWNDFNNNQAPTFEEATSQASAALNPMYDEQMKTTLQNVGNQMKSRGFYGQLPGDILTQNAAAKVEEARAGAVGNMANQFYQAGKDRQMQGLSLGLGTFGTYGQTPTTPTTATTATPASSKKSTLDEALKKVSSSGMISGAFRNL